MTHPGELTLRRVMAEEPLAPEVTSHVASCGECTARLERLRAEQRDFEMSHPFDHFAAGVERANRAASKPRRRSWLPVVASLAAVFLAVLVGFMVSRNAGGSSSRIKGGATADFVIAAANGLQREAGAIEQLAEGERVRIGVRGGRYVTALSIDEKGAVSTLYSETLEGVAGETWLPESLEFTGPGREHVVVVISDAPIDGANVGAALSRQFEAAKGDLLHLEPLDTPGVQVHRTFIKP